MVFQDWLANFKQSGKRPAARRRRKLLPPAAQMQRLEPRVLLTAMPAGPEFRVNTFTAGGQSSPSVATDADGNYVVTWNSSGQDGDVWGVYAQRYDAGGTALGSEFRVNTRTTGSQSLARVAMDADGDFLVTWTGYDSQDGSGSGIYAQRYASDGTALGGEFRVNTYTTGNQKRSQAAMDADGNFVIVWESASNQDGSGYGVYAQRYAANGATLGGEFRVNTYTTAGQGSADVAVNADGSFVVAWQSSGQDGNGIGIHAQRYSAAGTALGSEFQVNTYTTGFQYGPSVAIDAAGNFVVTWDSLNQDGGGSGVYGQRYASNGTTQGTEFRVNTYTTGSQQGSSVVMKADGSFVVTWESAGQDGDSYGIYAQRFASDGTAIEGEVRVNTYTTGSQNRPGVAMDAGGSFVVAWYGTGQSDSYGIYAQRFAEEVNSPPTGIVLSSNAVVQQQPAGLLVGSFSASDPDSNETFSYALVTGAGDTDNSRFDVVGNQLFTDYVFDLATQPTASIRVRVTDHGGLTFDQTFVISVIGGGPVGGEFRVNTATAGDQSTPGVAMDADGDVVVTWTSAGQDGSGLGVYARRYNSLGATVGGEFRVNTHTLGNQFDSRVAMDANGNFVITWTSSGQDGSGYGIYAQRYDASGSAVGGEFRVNTRTISDQSDPSLAVDADGDFVIVWSSYAQDGDGAGVYAQRYASSGAAIGGEFRVNTTTDSDQESARVAMDASGDFVVVWVSSWQDGGLVGVYAQRYASDGSTIGGEFRVNTYTADHQDDPAVAMDQDGSFVVSWSSMFQDDGASWGVYAQRYDAAGATVGAEFRVNTHTTGSQTSSSVAMDADGNFLVAWRSDLQDGSAGGVYAKRYNSLGTALGPEFRVNTFTAGDQVAPAVAIDSQGKSLVAWQSAGQDGSGQGILAQRYVDPGSAPTDVALSTNFVVQRRPAGTWVGAFSAVDADPDETFAYALVAGAGSADNARFDVVDGALVTAAVFDVDAQATASIRVRVTDGKGLTFEKALTLSIVRGGAVGSEWRVNTRTTNQQYNAAVAADADGDFLVTWTSYGQDGSGYGIYAQRYSAAGVALGSEFRVNSSISGNQMYSDVAMAPDGSFVVTYSSDAHDGSGWGVYRRRFDAAGVALESQVRVNTYTTSWQNFSSIAMDAAGNFVVVWQSLGQDGDDYGIYAQRYHANGLAQGSEFRVNTYTTNWQTSPSVAMDADGDFVIAWQSFGQDGQFHGVYAQRYASNGVAQGLEFRVNVTTPLNQSGPRVAMDDDGDFVIAWTGDNLDSSSYESYARRYAADGTPLTGEFRINSWTTGSQSVTGMAMEGDGSFVVAWTSDSQDGGGNGVYAQRFHADGTLDGGEFRVNAFTAGSQSQADVALGPGGYAVVAWTSNLQDGSNDGVYARRFLPGGPLTGFALDSSGIEENAPAGTPVGTLLPFDADPADQFTYTLIDGEGSQSNSLFTVVNGELRTTAPLDYEAAATRSIRVRASHASGLILERVLTIDVIDVNDAPTVHLVKRATTLPWNTTVTQRTKVADVVIRDDVLGTNFLSLAGPNADAFELIDTELFLRAGVTVDFHTTPALEVAVRVNDPALGGAFEDEARLSVGPPLAAARSGGEVAVNTTWSGNQDDPRIAMDADGNYVVTWTSNYDVYARRYAANGTALSGEFRVSSDTTFVQTHSDVAMDADGNFVVTWSGVGQDTSGGVYGRRYAADGTAIGGEFRVNSYRTGVQHLAHVAMNAAGEFVVIWHDDQRDGFEGVYAQRYSADGTAQGAEFRVNQSAGAGADPYESNSFVAIDAEGNFLVTWASEGGGDSGWDVFARWFAADGSPLGDEFLVNSHTTGDQSRASAAMDADGNFVIAWASGDSVGDRVDIFARRYSLNGIALGEEFRVSSSTVVDHVDPNVSIGSDGSFVIAWEGTTFFDDRYGRGDEGIYAQRFAADGTRVGREFRVNTTTTAVPYRASDLAVDPQGNFVVVWSSWYQDGSQGGVYAQRFIDGLIPSAPTGIELSDAHIVERQPAGTWVASLTATDSDDPDSMLYELAAGSGDDDNASFAIVDGQLVTAATFDLATQSSASIRVRVTDGYGLSYEEAIPLTITAGGPVGREFRVNSYTTDSQFSPNVAMDADGNFVVTWQDDSDYGVYIQRYSAIGMAIGADFRVGAYTPIVQSDSRVATDADGNFVVVWQRQLDVDDWSISARRFAADGTPLDDEFIVNTYTTGEHYYPHVAMDADGNFIVTWTSDSQDGSEEGVYARRYAADGTALGDAFRANSYTTGAQYLSRVALDADGDFVVTWVSDGQDGSGYGIYAQRFAADGNPVGGEFRVNVYTLGRQGESLVAMDDDGDFVVAWQSFDQDGSGFEIYARRYSADGSPLGGEFRVNTFTANGQFLASVVMDADGDFVITWTSDGQDGDDDGIYARVYAADGTPRSTEFRINTWTTGFQSAPSVALDSSGHFVVAWQSSGQDGSGQGIYAQRFVLSDGRAPTDIGLSSSQVVQRQSAGMRIGAFSSTDPDPWDDFTYSLVAGPGDDDNAKFEIVAGELRTTAPLQLAEQATASIRVQVTDLFGLTYEKTFALSIVSAGWAGGEFRVNTLVTGSQRDSAVAMDDQGNFVVTWNSYFQDGHGEGVFAQRYAADGTRAGSEFQVNTTTIGQQLQSSVAMDADGDFVVAWVSYGQDGDSGGVYAQRYDANGTAVGGEFRVNATTTNSQVLPSVAMDADGDFVVVWQSGLQDGDGFGVYAQRYDAFGNAVGGEFQVNSTGTGSQRFPEVAMDATGNFVVTWIGSASNGYGVYAQRYAVDGTALGAEFRIDTDDGSDPSFPEIAMDDAGNFIVAWRGRNQAGRSVVYAKRFAADGTILNGEFQVDAATGDWLSPPTVAMHADGSFVVGWSMDVFDGNGSGLYVQRYAADGSAFGEPLQAHSWTTNSQHAPSLAMDAAGNFAVVWYTEAAYGGGNAVFARRYVAGSPPTDLTLSAATIAENAAAGTMIGTFSTVDTDPGERLTYALVAGEGDSGNAFFAIDGDRLLSAAAIDFEATPTLTIRVRVTDSAGYVVENVLNISVGDVNEPPTVALNSLVASLPENVSTAARIKVADVVLTDDAPGPHNVLSLVGADADLFEIDGADLYLRAGVRLDFERNPRLDVAVRVDDAALGDDFEDVATLSINVTDVVESPPALGGFSGNVSYVENAAPVLLDTSVTVTSPDSAGFDTGTLTVMLTQNATADDRLEVRHQGDAANQVGIDRAGGVLRFGNVFVGTFTGGNGHIPLVITFNAGATAAAVRAVIQNLTFVNDSDMPSTLPRRVECVLTGGNGMSAFPAVKTINVSARNDAPVVGAFGGLATFVEGGAPVVLDSDATVIDADSADFNGGKLTVRFSANGHANDRLGIRHEGTAAGQVGTQTVGTTTNVLFGGTLVGTVVGGKGTTPLVVTFKTTANAAVVQAVLRNVVFSNVSTNPTTLLRTVQATLTDGDGGTSVAASISATVQPTNTPSTLGAFGGAVNFVKGGQPVLVSSAATFADPDSPNLNGGNLTVALTANAESTDRLRIRHQGTTAGQIGVNGSNVTFGGAANVIGTWTGGDGANPLVVTFTSNLATPAAVQALLRNLVFSSTAAIPSPLPRTLQVTVDDGDGGDGTSAPSAKTLGVVNNTVIGGWSGSATYREDAPAMLLDTSVTLADPDTVVFDNFVLTAAVAADGDSEDRLGVKDNGIASGKIGVNGISVTFGGTVIGALAGGDGTDPLTITLNGAATTAAVKALLMNLTYRNASNAPSTAPRTVTLTLSDPDGTPNAASSKTISVTAVNDAPVLGDFGPSVDYGSANGPVLVAPTAAVTDPDGLDFAGGKLTLQLTKNAQGADRLRIRNTGADAEEIAVNGANVTYGGTVIGTFVGGSGSAALVITFNAAARQDAVQALLRSIEFTSTAFPASLSHLPRTLKATLTDGDGGTSAAPTKTINVA